MPILVMVGRDPNSITVLETGDLIEYPETEEIFSPLVCTVIVPDMCGAGIPVAHVLY